MPADLLARTFQISGVHLRIVGAWIVTDYTPLLAEANQRGNNRLIPHVDGLVAYRKRRDETRIVVPIEVFGVCDVDGLPYADPVSGLEQNILYLNEMVVAPTGTGDGTRVAVLTLPDVTLTADVQVVDMSLGYVSPSWRKGSLEMIVPAGKFDVDGS